MSTTLYFILASDGSGMVERTNFTLAEMRDRWPTSSVSVIKDGVGIVASDFIVRFVMGQYYLKEDSSEVPGEE